MFGLFKKKTQQAGQQRKLAGFILLQNSILLELVKLLKRINEKGDNSGGQDTATGPEDICGRWQSRREGICLYIRKGAAGYCACLPDRQGTGKAYPLRTYRGMCYFTLGSYAIFIEYDKAKHEIRLCGKLPLPAAGGTTFYPGIPLEFNPN